MTLAGAAWLAGAVIPGLTFAHRGPLVHLHLSYPSGRLRRRAVVAVSLAVYTVSLGGIAAAGPRGGSDAGDVGGEEVDAVSVEVASGAVVVLGGSGVGVAGQDLGVAQGDARVEGVGDRSVA